MARTQLGSLARARKGTRRERWHRRRSNFGHNQSSAFARQLRRIAFAITLNRHCAVIRNLPISVGRCHGINVNALARWWSIEKPLLPIILVKALNVRGFVFVTIFCRTKLARTVGPTPKTVWINKIDWSVQDHRIQIDLPEVIDRVSI